MMDLLKAWTLAIALVFAVASEGRAAEVLPREPGIETTIQSQIDAFLVDDFATRGLQASKQAFFVNAVGPQEVRPSTVQEVFLVLDYEGSAKRVAVVETLVKIASRQLNAKFKIEDWTAKNESSSK